MKKIDILFLVFTLSVVLFCFSCQNQLLPQPGSTIQIGPTNSKNWGKPDGLTSTQGLKQEIILSWTPIKEATRYYIYRASSPFDTFVQIGETKDASTLYSMKVPAGTDMYYKITAVDAYGNESPFSEVVRGTSLEQPTISDIIGLDNQADSSATVYWYMGNVDAYQNQVRYTVICSDAKGTEVARVLLDGAVTEETSVTFDNLSPHTDYTYTVEAYLVLDQNSTEASEPMNAETARRLRPNSPEASSATGGASKDYIQISFQLPELVDVAVSSGVYEQKPLFFKIYRRIKASQDEFVPITTYFGVDPTDETLGKTNFGYNEYIPGEIVSWTDSVDLKRGVIYEYKIQAFADSTTRVITSDLSTSLVDGWLIAQPSFKTTDYIAVKNEEETVFISSSLAFNLTWDSFGKESEYDFIIDESCQKFLADGTTSSETQQGLIQYFDNIQDVNNFVRTFDLTNTDICGYYRYSIHIVPQGCTDISSALDTVQAIGQILVTENIEQPAIKEFSIISGYSDKIIFEWDYNDTYSYSLRYWEEDDSSEGTLVSSELIYAALEGKTTGDTIHLELEAEPGTKRNYILYATTFITKGTTALEGSTAGIPEARIKNYSYDSINIEWNQVDFASSYNLSAKYNDSNIAQLYEIPNSEVIQAENSTEYSFTNIPGCNVWSVSGLPVTVKLEATTYISKNTLSLNVDGETYQKTTETLSDSDSISCEITSQTTGPALVNSLAQMSMSDDSIKLSWNKVQGASAYAIIRNRYHILPGGSDSYKSTDTYLVNTENGINVSLLGSIGDVAGAVTVTTDGSTFSLIDSSIEQTDETISWQSSQEQIKWGCPFDYVVLPLVSSSDSPEYDYVASKKSISIKDITFTDIPFSRGSALGYGWNVTASKGWETSALSGTSTSAINSSIYVSWEPPSLSNIVQPSYQIYRKEEGTSTWSYINTVETTRYADTSAVPGRVYEYAIGLVFNTEQSTPNSDIKYIEFSDTKMDEYDTNEKAASGFILPLVQITSASREQRSNANGYSELIKWPCTEIGNVSNRMISGYVIEVFNNNISSDWNIIKDVPLSTEEEFSTKLFQHEVDNSSGLLKVLRDYKHYFRIRVYREKDGKRSYSAIPEYTWSDGAEDNYVKWGARQITAQEFCKMANLAITYGLKLVNGTAWNTAYDGFPIYGRDADVSSPSSGAIRAESNFAVNNWDIMYTNYTIGWNSKTGNTFTFLTVNGTLNPKTEYSNQYPKSYDSGTITINSNNPMGFYNGTITYSGLTKTGGSMTVNYNGSSSTFGYTGNSPLPFKDDDYHHEDEEWK